MDFDRYEFDLLNKIEDAERDLRRGKRAFRRFAAGLPVALVFLFGGTAFGFWGTLNEIDTGGPAVLLIILGVIGTVVSITGMIAFYVINEVGGWNSPSDVARSEVVREARRAHQLHVGARG